MNIPQHSRLKGLHRRHHEKKGIKKPGCSFCEMPSLGAKKGEAKSIVASEPDHYEELAREAERNVAKSLERDRLWSCAQSGMSALDSMKVLDIPQLQLFVAMVEGNFKKSWVEVLAQAKLCVKRDLTTSAIREAQSGDTRLLLKLMDQGFFSSWMQDEREEGLKNATTAELEERLLKYLEKSDIRKKLEPTITAHDATPEEIKAFEQHGSIEAAPSATISAVDFARPDLRVMEAVKQEDVPSPSVQVEEPVALEQGPATYCPEPAFPLSPRITRGDL